MLNYNVMPHVIYRWDHYANRWEILSPEKEMLATHVLHHPHDNEQPVTRSLSSVKLPKNIDYILVRGHDKMHGYGNLFQFNLLPK